MTITEPRAFPPEPEETYSEFYTALRQAVDDDPEFMEAIWDWLRSSGKAFSNTTLIDRLNYLQERAEDRATEAILDMHSDMKNGREEEEHE